MASSAIRTFCGIHQPWGASAGISVPPTERPIAARTYRFGLRKQWGFGTAAARNASDHPDADVNTHDSSKLRSNADKSVEPLWRHAQGTICFNRIGPIALISRTISPE